MGRLVSQEQGLPVMQGVARATTAEASEPKPVAMGYAAVLYQSGLPLSAIARQLGVSKQAVHQQLAKQGVPRRARGGNQGSHSRHRR